MAIAIAEVCSAKIDFGARARECQDFDGLAAQVHCRVQARAGRVDLGDDLASQVGLVHLSLQLTAYDDPAVLSEDVQDVDRSNVVRTGGQFKTLGINRAEGP